jgi:heat shock protein HslJ
MGKTWQVTGLTTSVPLFSGELPADQQPNYTIEFLPDGTFKAKADCNQVSGSYTTADPNAASGDLTVTPGPSTMAFCPEGSYSDLYILALSLSTSYVIDATGLTITMNPDGKLTFK